MKNSEKCCTANRKSNSESRKPKVKIESKRSSTEGMIRLPEGSFLMGTNTNEGFPQDGEGPVRKVQVDSFWIDEKAVTNAEFLKFIRKNGC